MKTPRDLTGEELAKHLQRHWSYTLVRQVGSHMRLQTDDPSRHSITIPRHHPLKAGTLQAILKEVAEHKQVSTADLLREL